MILVGAVVGIVVRATRFIFRHWKGLPWFAAAAVILVATPSVTASLLLAAEGVALIVYAFAIRIPRLARRGITVVHTEPASRELERTRLALAGIVLKAGGVVVLDGDELAEARGANLTWNVGAEGVEIHAGPQRVTALRVAQ